MIAVFLNTWPFINRVYKEGVILKLKDVCPKCYAATGFSIVMEEEKGIFFCPKNATHRFKKDKDGFFLQHTL